MKHSLNGKLASRARVGTLNRRLLWALPGCLWLLINSVALAHESSMPHLHPHGDGLPAGLHGIGVGAVLLTMVGVMVLVLASLAARRWLVRRHAMESI